MNLVRQSGGSSDPVPPSLAMYDHPKSLTSQRHPQTTPLPTLPPTKPSSPPPPPAPPPSPSLPHLLVPPRTPSPLRNGNKSKSPLPPLRPPKTLNCRESSHPASSERSYVGTAVRAGNKMAGGRWMVRLHRLAGVAVVIRWVLGLGRRGSRAGLGGRWRV